MRKSRYEIELGIKGDDKVRAQIREIDDGVASISESASNLDFKGALNGAQELSKKMAEVAKGGEDATLQMNAFESASKKAIKELEKQASDLTYSLSEQGKAQRARLRAIDDEIAKLGKSKEDAKKRKELEKERAKIAKTVVDLSDEELKQALRLNQASRAELKLAVQNGKLMRTETKEQKKLAQLVKDDLKGIKDKIKAQFEFIKALKTTEGRYNALKKAGALGVKAGVGIAKGAGKAALGGIGIAAAAVGAIASNAGAATDTAVERERAAARVRGLSQEQASEAVSRIYSITGADSERIVAAIHAVQSVLGRGLSVDDLVQTASGEVLSPGISALYRQQTKGDTSASALIALANQTRASTRETGASIEQIASAREYLANTSNRTQSKAPLRQQEAVYLSLLNSGAFDDEAEVQEAYKRFISRLKPDEDIFEAASRFDWTSGLTTTNKIQASNAIKATNWEALRAIGNQQYRGDALSLTSNEERAVRMRATQERLQDVQLRVLEAIDAAITDIGVEKIKEMVDSLLHLATELVSRVLPVLIDIITMLKPILRPLINTLFDLVRLLGEAVKWLKTNDVGEKTKSTFDVAKNFGIVGLLSNLFGDDEDEGATLNGHARADGGVASIPTIAGERGAEMIIPFDYGHARADGGVASIPTIVGEQGAEMVIPFDYARRGRANNLIQTFNQTFNLAQNQTTASSLAATMRTNGRWGR